MNPPHELRVVCVREGVAPLPLFDMQLRKFEPLDHLLIGEQTTWLRELGYFAGC